MSIEKEHPLTAAHEAIRQLSRLDHLRLLSIRLNERIWVLEQRAEKKRRGLKRGELDRDDPLIPRLFKN